jgi:ubiquinone biosynthesis protein
LTVLARHGFGGVVSSLPLHRIPGLRKPEGIDSEGPKKIPARERLVSAFQDLGPSFVKLGQMLSTRPDVLPGDWIESFAKLQDQVAPFPGEQARKQVEEALGGPVEEIFEEFSREPVASASIAQVHTARLNDGSRVAVKIQRPGIEKTLRSDINIMYMLGELLEGRLDLGVYTPTKVVEAFDRAISREVDFLNEAANGQAFAKALEGMEGVYVPKVHRTLTTRTVLTMEWIDGHKLSDIDKSGADRELVMDRLVEAMYCQIFQHGIFHADPHPGNLVVNDDSVLTFLDFGLMGRITPEMRDTLEGLLVGIIFRDADTIARTIYRAGSADGRVKLRDLSADVEVLLQRWGGTKFDEQDTSKIALDIISLARRHRLRLPEEYAILARTEVTLDGIARNLVPDWDPLEALKPHETRLTSERLNPQRVGGDLARQLVSMSGMLKDAPGQLDQILLDLEQGNFEINARTPSIEQLERTLDRVGRALVYGLGVSALLLSASILIAAVVLDMGQRNTFSDGDIAATVIAGGSAMFAMMLLGGITWNLFLRGFLSKIRWARFLGLVPVIGKYFRGGTGDSNRSGR